MSYVRNAYVICGFPAPLNYREKGLTYVEESGRAFYLDEWCDAMRLRPVEQVNAGCANDGTPDYLLGVVLHKLEDFERGQAYVRMPQATPVPPESWVKITRAAELLRVPQTEIGIYLVGERG